MWLLAELGTAKTVVINRIQPNDVAITCCGTGCDIANENGCLVGNIQGKGIRHVHGPTRRHGCLEARVLNIFFLKCQTKVTGININPVQVGDVVRHVVSIQIIVNTIAIDIGYSQPGRQLILELVGNAAPKQGKYRVQEAPGKTIGANDPERVRGIRSMDDIVHQISQSEIINISLGLALTIE